MPRARHLRRARRRVGPAGGRPEAQIPLKPTRGRGPLTFQGRTQTLTKRLLLPSSGLHRPERRPEPPLSHHLASASLKAVVAAAPNACSCSRRALNLLNGFLTTLELSLSSSSTSVQTPDLGRGYRPLSEAPCEKARNFGSIKTRSGPGVPPPAL